MSWPTLRWKLGSGRFRQAAWDAFPAAHKRCSCSHGGSVTDAYKKCCFSIFRHSQPSGDATRFYILESMMLLDALPNNADNTCQVEKAPPCIQCGDTSRKRRRRGLCSVCWKPSETERNRVLGTNLNPAGQMPEPTNALPGHPEKIVVMIQRVHDGKSVVSPRDRRRNLE